MLIKMDHKFVLVFDTATISNKKNQKKKNEFETTGRMKKKHKISSSSSPQTLMRPN